LYETFLFTFEEGVAPWRGVCVLNRKCYCY